MKGTGKQSQGACSCRTKFLISLWLLVLCWQDTHPVGG